MSEPTCTQDPRGSHSAAVAVSDLDARIFELVEQCKHWWAQIGHYGRLCDEVVARNEGRAVLPEHEDSYQAAMNTYQEAYDELLGLTPQTVAGARAMLEWVKQDSKGVGLQNWHAQALLENLLASPILTLAAQA